MNLSKEIKLFLVVTFFFSTGISLLIFLTGGQESPYYLISYSLMIIPAITVGIIRLIFREKFSIGFKNFNLKWFLVGIVIFPLVIHAVCLPVVWLEADYSIPWVSWLKSDANGIFNTPEQVGWGSINTNELYFRLILNAIVGLLVVSILALFEELGWRSWLLPRLIQEFGIHKAILVSAAIWAAWHIPFALSGIHTIEGVSPYWIAVLNPFGHFGAGVFLAFLWIKSKSIWVVAFAHGSLNNWGQFAFKYMSDDPSPRFPLLLIGLNLSLILIGLFTFRLTFGKHHEQKYLS